MNDSIRAVLLTGPLDVTAANLRTLDLARELLRRKIEVTVVAGPGELEQRFQAAEIPLATLEITGRFIEDLPQLGALKKTVGGIEPHLLHVIDPALFRHGSAVTRAFGSPLILSLDSVPHRSITSHFGLLRGILVPARSVRDELILKRRAPAELIHIVPPGIDISRFPTTWTPFAGGRPILGTVTPLPKAPGLDTLLTVVRLLKEREISLHLMIAGHGPGDLALRGQIRNAGLAREVTVTGMPIDLERVFTTLDIYLRAARPGGFGAALLMAMAAGRPVIAEGQGPALALVREGETGFLTPSGDAGRMADRIAGLIESPDRALACGAAGLKSAQEMTMAITAGIVEALYREVVSVPS